MYKRHTASGSIKFCHALWQVPFYQKTNCCSSSSNPVNDVDLLEVKRRRTPFSIRSNVLRKYFLRCTALVVRIDRQGRVWVVVVAQPPISCCEWWRKNPENLYLLVGSILALWGRWRRRRRSYVCLHFSHPISTSSYGNVHTAHTYFDWFRRTLKQSVSNGRSGAFRGVVKCMRRRHYRGLACALICLSGMAQLDSNERPSTGDVKAWSQMPLDRCVCVCAETAENISEYRLRWLISCISFAPKLAQRIWLINGFASYINRMPSYMFGMWHARKCLSAPNHDPECDARSHQNSGYHYLDVARDGKIGKA